MNNKVIIEPSWYQLLKNEFNKIYFSLLIEKVREAYEMSSVFPPPKLIFNAFKFTPVSKSKLSFLVKTLIASKVTKVYHLVSKKYKIPPSLVNIYKINNDLNIKIPNNGN